MAFAGFSMINNIEVALRAGVIKIPKNTIMKMEEIVKLPDDKITVVCTGSQDYGGVYGVAGGAECGAEPDGDGGA